MLDEVVVVKPIIQTCLCLIIVGCAASDGFDNRNFAIDTYFPRTNEIQPLRGMRELLGSKWSALWAGTQVFGCGYVKFVPIRGPLSKTH